MLQILRNLRTAILRNLRTGRGVGRMARQMTQAWCQRGGGRPGRTHTELTLNSSGAFRCARHDVGQPSYLPEPKDHEMNDSTGGGCRATARRERG
jgi:hypothetical protein